jgi:hypothetical protein
MRTLPQWRGENPGYTWTRMDARFFQSRPFPGWIAHGPFAATGPADLRPFFCWAQGLEKKNEKKPREEIRRNFLFTRPQKKFDKIIFLLLSRK